ncbi:MAG: hypothetical protein ABSH32_00205 [Bryobacteraceae bacterium]|jgi:hypothetical protein
MFHRSLPKIAVALAVLLALITVAPSPMSAQGSRYSLTFNNYSGLRIDRIYMSTSESGRWGPDQLRENRLWSGSYYTLTGITPGEYDVKFVDGRGFACTLYGVNVFRDLSWDLTRQWLLGCEYRR